MKHLKSILVIVLVVGMAGGVVFSPSALAAKPLDTGKIEGIVGLRGASKSGEYKVSIPQNDLSVQVDGFRITPPMGLTSWVDFAPSEHGTMVMGDIILKENEIGPVEKAVVENGLTVTGLHNHFIRDDQKVMYMHIEGMGPAEKMARSVRAVLDKVSEVRGENPAQAQSASVQSSIDTNKIESIIGHKGEESGGVFKVTIGRPDVSLRDHGTKVTTFGGFNTWAAFQGTNDKAAVAGDFVMLDREVAPVIQALVENGIEVVAVHNHMVHEKPRVFFLHYWGVGPAAKLAQGLKVALAQTGNASKAK